MWPPDFSPFPWRSASIASWDAEIGAGLELPLLGPVQLSPDRFVVEPAADFGLAGPVLRAPAVVSASPGQVCAWRPVEHAGRIRWASVAIGAAQAVLRVSDDAPLIPEPTRAVLVADELGEDAARTVATVWQSAGQTWMAPGWLPADGLAKSEPADIPPGARWITVHPHGEGTKGQPVLVLPVKDEKGAFRVIGGAGGRLHMLKLRGVKDPGEYASEAKARADQRRAARRAQIEADKAAGVHEAKQAAREDVRQQRRQAERSFVGKVAQALGWKLPEGYLDDGSLDGSLDAGGVKQGVNGSDKQADKKGVHARLLAAARRAVRRQRDMLVADAERLAQAELGLQSGDEALSAADLDPVRPKEGGAVRHAWGARAAAAGLTAEDKAAKVAESKGGAVSPSVPMAGKDQPEPAADPLAGVDLGAGEALSPKHAADLLREMKKLHAVQRQAREALGAIDREAEPKAYVIRASDEAVDEAVVADLEDQIRARSGSAFLAAVEASGGESALEQHVAAGAHGFLDEVGQFLGGRSLVDRSTVDALGVAGAARALAWRLHHELGAQKVQEVAQSLQDRHVAETGKQLDGAMARARALHEEAEGAALDQVSGSDEIAAAFSVHRRRQEALTEARQVLGQALGASEASAALALALQEKPADSLQLSLGMVGADQAAVRLAALGLRPDDYTLTRAGDGVIAEIGASGLARLSQSFDPAEIERLQANRAIIDGQADEDGWLPEGFARRPDLDQDMQPGVAPALAEPMDWQAEDRAQALKDYIGLRYADGHAPASILGDLQSSTFLQHAGDAKAYLQTLDAVLPLRDAKGKLRRVEDLAPLMQQYADAAVAARYGAGVSSLNRQRLVADEVTREAMFRALARVPEGKVAYKAVGELTDADRRVLRDFFARHVAKESPEQAALREKVEALKGQEPQRFVEDMFGEETESPLWQSWRQDMDQATAAWNASGLSWPRYVQIMGGRKRAWRAVQDLIRSRLSEAFAEQHNRLRPDAPLKVGRTVIADNLRHLDAVDPAAREKRLAEHRALVDALRARVRGRYAQGAVSDRLDALMASRAAFQQSQMSFFASDETGPADEPLRPDERVTLGHAAEQQLAAMAREVGAQVKPGAPVKLFNPAFSGPAGVKRQRMVKLLKANRRLIAAAGVGSGKTAIGLAGFTELHAEGKVKKGLFVVPSVVQGQFDAEALRFLEPDRYRWHAKPGGSFEERLAAYKDPGTHFAVVTHQAFRDDVLRMAALRDGVSPAEVAAKMEAMTREQRADYVRGVLQHHGVAFDYVMADEAHGLLDRDGKEDSRLSQVVAAVTDHAPYYVHASADPVKNDLSEVHSLLSKMDPARYADKGAFMRRFGGGLKASGQALRRELLRYGYAMALKPDVPVTRTEVKVSLSEGQQAALKDIDRASAALRLARMQGKTDVKAARQLAPAAFEGVPEDQHEQIAADLARSVGMVRQSAVRRVIDEHPESAKLAQLSDIAQQRKGQQGVVFARSLAAVEAIKKRLEAQGLRVGTITGKQSSEQKGAVIRGFNPDQGPAQFDVVVASDAGAVGANLQSGRWLAQYDTPDTAMAQPLDALVLCPSGWRRMGDLAVGDEVMTPCGDRSRIVGVYPQGVKPIYRLCFSDGASALACGDHLWATQSRDDDRAGRGWRNRTTEHLRRTLMSGGRSNYRIPLVGRIDCEAQNLPIPPYTLGALLGDGHFGGSYVSLSGVDQFVFDRVAAEIQPMGARLSKVGDIDYRLIGDGSHAGVFPRRMNSPIVDAARALGLHSAEKFVPDAYLVGRFDDRLALLQGLMDTDGTCDHRYGVASFTNTNRRLIDAVISLVQSLGGVAGKEVEFVSRHNGKPGMTGWRVCVILPDGVNPFSLPRKAQRAELRRSWSKMTRRIEKIELVGEMEAQCILIDHPSHLYVTEQFVVTHNTHAQRQGRIHRIGQKGPVELLDLVADHEVEAKARRRLAEKYDLRELLTSPMEGMDDSGLAWWLTQKQVQGGLF